MNNKTVFRFRDGFLPLGSRTYIMGIINVTPDSFSDGGDNFTPEQALKTALEFEKQGADILDIGGQSTRPGAATITPDEEWERLKDVLPLILKHIGIPISIDTFYPEVAEKALKIGCHIINDVSGAVNSKMAEVIQKYNAGWVLMHSAEENSSDISERVHNRLLDMLDSAVSFGINREYICLDPGIGFGKTMKQNLKLIAETERVKIQNTAYLLGVSRKRVIGYALDNDSISFKERDFGTVAANTIGILGGADILRVHNVLAAVQTASVTNKLLEERNNNDV